MNEGLTEPVPDAVLSDYWTSHVLEIATDPDNPTDAEHALIEQAVLTDLGVDTTIPF